MTKVDIISGFLGAGKTTFIKKLIEDVFPGERLVLIENEFGEIGIDGGFLKDAGVQDVSAVHWWGILVKHFRKYLQIIHRIVSSSNLQELESFLML